MVTALHNQQSTIRRYELQYYVKEFVSWLGKQKAGEGKADPWGHE
jgi:hypothetical protein